MQSVTELKSAAHQEVVTINALRCIERSLHALLRSRRGLEHGLVLVVVVGVSNVLLPELGEASVPERAALVHATRILLAVGSAAVLGAVEGPEDEAAMERVHRDVHELFGKGANVGIGELALLHRLRTATLPDDGLVREELRGVDGQGVEEPAVVVVGRLPKELALLQRDDGWVVADGSLLEEWWELNGHKA